MINKTKSAVITTNKRPFQDITEYKGFPIVDSYKYLRCLIGTRTRIVVASALNMLKKKVKHIKIKSTGLSP
jgi:hypothetical protein